VESGMTESDWEVLVDMIRDGTCTPFLGAGASAGVLPTGTALAARWADEHGYPLAERGDLARVAQYIALTRDSLWVKRLVAKLCTSIDIAAALQPGDCYDMISDLDLPIFVTTNYDDLLLHALRHKGKDPLSMVCPWNHAGGQLVGKTYTYKPTPQRPAVYHLHGNAQNPGTIVLTEDDYLDFIVWVTQNWEKQASQSHVAPAVKTALGENSLLFIGYSQNDWSFRVLMRSIKQTGAGLGATNIAVQLSPLDENADEVDRENVESYLTKYFEQFQVGNKIRLFWGTAEMFMKELKTRLAKT
jgi:hypothetical protein